MIYLLKREWLPDPPGPKTTKRFIFLYAAYIGEDYNSRISQIDF